MNENYYNDTDDVDVKNAVHQMALEAARSAPSRVREEDVYRRPEQSSYQERGTEAQIAALYGALAKARGEFAPFTKTKRVEVRSKEGRLLYPFEYAPMDVLLAATTPALSANGLVVMMPFVTAQNDTTRQLVIIAHAQGGRLCFEFEFCPNSDEKLFGGQTTYLQRYCYRSVLTLAADGDLEEQPTRKGEDSVTVEPIQRATGSERLIMRNGRAPTVSAPPAAAPTNLELNLKEMLDLAKKVGFTKRSQVAEFVWQTVSNGQPFALGEPFCSVLTEGQLEKCFTALTNRLDRAAGGAR